MRSYLLRTTAAWALALVLAGVASVFVALLGASKFASGFVAGAIFATAWRYVEDEL